jgi:hypothetical protein
MASLIQNMGVDHRSADIVMTQQLLDRANIVAGFKQVRSERTTGSKRLSKLIQEPEALVEAASTRPESVAPTSPWLAATCIEFPFTCDPNSTRFLPEGQRE